MERRWMELQARMASENRAYLEAQEAKEGEGGIFGFRLW